MSFSVMFSFDLTAIEPIVMKTTPSFLTIYHQRLAALLVLVSMLILAACSQQVVNETIEPLALSMPGLDSANDVAVVGPNLYVMGSTTGSLDGNNVGATDIFVRRYATNGTLVWGRQFGTASYDYASYLATSGSGDVYVVGSAAGRATQSWQTL